MFLLAFAFAEVPHLTPREEPQLSELASNYLLILMPQWLRNVLRNAIVTFPLEKYFDIFIFSGTGCEITAWTWKNGIVGDRLCVMMKSNSSLHTSYQQRRK
eukprot:6324774-Amphidinium_carterae.1